MEQPLEKIRAPARLQKIAAKLGKYKYALLVLLLGIVLALIPTGGKQQSAASAPDTTQAELSQLEETREALRALLRQAGLHAALLADFYAGAPEPEAARCIVLDYADAEPEALQGALRRLAAEITGR